MCSQVDYNAAGEVITRTDALGHFTTFEYDGLGRLAQETDPLDRISEYTYDVNGNRVQSENAKGVATRFGYDALGRLEAVVENYQPGVGSDEQTNVRTEYVYDAQGNRLAITDALAHTTTFGYNNLGWLVRETDPLSNTWRYRYDAAGQRVTMEDAKLQTTDYEYDGMGRLVRIDYPDTDVTFAFNALGWRTAMTDTLGVTRWQYDLLGRPLTITHPISGTVGYRYDAQGNRTALIYPDGKQASYQYDMLDRLSQVTSWDSQATTYTYTVNSALKAVRFPDGVTSTYAYDPSGQLSALTHQGQSGQSSSFEYQYDPVGNRTQADESITWPYQLADGFESGDFSRWTGSVTDGGDLSVSTQAALQGTYGMKALIDDQNAMYVVDNRMFSARNYTASFNLKIANLSMACDKSLTILQGYHASGQSVFSVGVECVNVGSVPPQDGGALLNALSSPPGGTYRYYVWAKPYTDTGPSNQVIRIEISSSFSGNVRIEWQAAQASGTDDGALTLVVRKPQEVSSAIVDIDNDSLAVDEIRLGALAVGSGLSGWFAVDTFDSNMDAMNQSETISYTYDDLNRLTNAIYSSGPAFTYTHDAAGNRLSQTTPAGTTDYTYDDANRLANTAGVTYTWDANGNLLWDGVYTYTYTTANRLASVSSGPSSVVNYSYNGLGDRVRQTSGGATTDYAIDLAGGLTQVLADGTNVYLYGNGRIAQYGAGGVDYFLGDALGSVRQLVNGNGNVTLAKRYEPYGEELAHEGTASSIYGYTGEITNPTGLVYLRARYYAPWQGRFISRDTWEGDYTRSLSLNKWIYVESNPVTYQDPTGKFRIPCPASWRNGRAINRRVDEAEKYVQRTFNEIDTYVAAGIAIQCAGLDNPLDPNSGLGIAQVSRNQAETPWGNPIYAYMDEYDDSGNLTCRHQLYYTDNQGNIKPLIRGYGLRLGQAQPGEDGTMEKALDPNNPQDAVTLMKRRIQLVTNACMGCLATDIYIAAALAQNGPGFTHVDMKSIGELSLPMKNDYPDTAKNWFAFFKLDWRGDPSMRDTKLQLIRFDLVIHKLITRGWFVPEINNEVINKLKWKNWAEE